MPPPSAALVLSHGLAHLDDGSTEVKHSHVQRGPAHDTVRSHIRTRSTRGQPSRACGDRSSAGLRTVDPYRRGRPRGWAATSWRERYSHTGRCHSALWPRRVGASGRCMSDRSSARNSSASPGVPRLGLHPPAARLRNVGAAAGRRRAGRGHHLGEMDLIARRRLRRPPLGWPYRHDAKAAVGESHARGVCPGTRRILGSGLGDPGAGVRPAEDSTRQVAGRRPSEMETLGRFHGRCVARRKGRRSPALPLERRPHPGQQPSPDLHWGSPLTRPSPVPSENR